MIDHVSQGDGKSFISFAAKIGTCRDTLNEWAKVHPEFGVAKRKAKEIQETALMDIGMRGMQGQLPAFHNAAWIFWMKARFGWSDEGPQEQEDAELVFV